MHRKTHWFKEIQNENQLYDEAYKCPTNAQDIARKFSFARFIL